ncbi:MAG: hypothetical protein AB1492_07970 [Bacillota bacterium]
MDKHQLVAVIAERLEGLGVPPEADHRADLVVKREIVSQSWGLGKKTISYECSIWADETAHTVFMWEKTTEASRGLSFGAGSSSCSQSGKQVHRKVSGIYYGADGQAHKFNVDLGAIPKTVKAAAEGAEWKFAVAVRREQAQHPGP